MASSTKSSVRNRFDVSVENINDSKVDKILLDSFWNLAETNQEIRLKAAQNILNSLYQSQKGDSICSELSYCIQRLIKGLGSTRKAARQGFALVLIEVLRSFQVLDLNDIINQMKQYLPLNGGNKSDIGRNAIGQILCFGAIIRSGRLKITPDMFGEVVANLLALQAKRSYIQQTVNKLFMNIFNQLNDKDFKHYIWPQIKDNLNIGWEEYTPDILLLLLLCSRMFPESCSSKFLKKHLNTEDVLNKENFSYLARIIKNSTSSHPFIHPVCIEIVNESLKREGFKKFWKIIIDENLFTSGLGTKAYLGFELIKVILPKLQKKKQVECVLLSNFALVFLKSSLNQHSSLNSAASEMGDFLVRFTSECEKPAIQTAVMKIFLKPPGTLLFDKLTKKKTLSNIISHLKSDAVKSYAEMLKSIFLGTENEAIEGSYQEQKRIFAIHQMSGIFSHQAMVSEKSWKLECIQFLLLHSFFVIKECCANICQSSEVPVDVSDDLREACRASFIRALEFLLRSSSPKKISHIEEKSEIMVKLLHYAGDILNLTKNFTLVNNTNKIQEQWDSILHFTEKLQKQQRKDGRIQESCAFQILFAYLGFQLFIEPLQTFEILEELKECCKRSLKNRRCASKSLTDNEERIKDGPLWINVITELMLALLSQSSHLSRSVVISVFPLFGPFMSNAAIQQIMDVIDPTKNSDDGGPLANNENDDDVSFESGSSDEEVDEANQFSQTSDELQKRLRLALGTDVSNDNSEHYLSDSEMFKLDGAIAEAFASHKAVKENANKDETELLHFRLRCLDIMLLLLKSEPPMEQVLLLILPLVNALEYSHRKKGQQFLAEKIKRFLPLITKYKKNISGVNQQMLSMLLKSLMEKVKKATDLEISKHLNQLCTYLVTCGNKCIESKEDSSETKFWYIEDYKDLLKDFLENQATHIQPDIFVSLMNACPETSWEFVDHLSEYVFHENIRLYKKTQILGMLLTAMKCSENLPVLTKKIWKKFCKTLLPKIIKALEEITKTQEIKPTYTMELLDILVTIFKISAKFEMKVLKDCGDLCSLQNLTPKQCQKLQRKGRHLLREVSKFLEIKPS